MARGGGNTRQAYANRGKSKKNDIPNTLAASHTQTSTVDKQNRDLPVRSRNEPLIRNPSLTHPWARNAGTTKSGVVWLHLNAKRILDQQSKGVGAVTVPIGKPDVQFAFLAPLALTETNAHNWAEYDSLSSRLAQKIRTAAKVGAEWKAIKNAFKITPEDTAKNRLAKGVDQGALVSDWLKQIYNDHAKSYSIPKLKVDTPLYYESSDRRALNFEVMLIAERSPKEDVVDIVQTLMKYAAPDLKGGIDIQFPYMFEVYTQPNKWLNYTTLALTAVQPTWNHPFYDGYPSSCNLQLTFKDLSPLYRGAIETGSVINVIQAGASNRKRADGTEPTTLQVKKDNKTSAGDKSGSTGFGPNEPFGDAGGYA